MKIHRPLPLFLYPLYSSKISASTTFFFFPLWRGPTLTVDPLISTTNERISPSTESIVATPVPYGPPIWKRARTFDAFFPFTLLMEELWLNGVLTCNGLPSLAPTTSLSIIRNRASFNISDDFNDWFADWNICWNGRTISEKIELNPVGWRVLRRSFRRTSPLGKEYCVWGPSE